MTFQPNKQYLVTIPVWPKENPSLTQWQSSAFPQNVLPPAPPGGTLRIAAFKPGFNSYYYQDQYDGNGYPYIGLVKPYRAFWVMYSNVSSSVTASVSGAVAGVKSAHEIEVPLSCGYNLVGNPFLYKNMILNDTYVRFRRLVGTTNTVKTLTEAITAGWVNRSFWGWTPNTSKYYQISLGASIAPYTGFSLYCCNPGNDTTMLVKSP